MISKITVSISSQLTFASAPSSNLFVPRRSTSACKIRNKWKKTATIRMQSGTNETRRESTRPQEELHVLVTGATGFLGSHLVDALAEQGYVVHSISRKPLSTVSTSPTSLSPSRHYVCDLTSTDTTLAEILQQRQWHAVIHLAGLISYASKDALAMEKTNIHATRHLVDNMIINCPSTKLLFCSSVVSVGSNPTKDAPLVNESHPWDPSLEHIGYVRTKNQAEQIVRLAGESNKLPTTCICPSNIFGAGDYKKSSRKTQIRAANGKQRLYTDGGVSVVHVSVVVDLFIKALKCELTESDVWNGTRWLATGDNITIHRMLELFSEKGGNKQYAPFLALPNWLLCIFCFIGELMGSSSMTMDRFQLATRFHWFDGSRAKLRFGLKSVPADAAIGDSVAAMRENGFVKPRS